MVVEVIINSTVKNLNRTFDYSVPTQLVGTIKVGDRVLVPFGNSKKLEEGFVIGIKQNSEFKVKDISRIQKGFSLKEQDIELAKWMARRYFCNVSDCIKMFLPPGTTTKVIDNRVKEKTLNFVYLKKDIDEIDYLIETREIKSDKQIRILEFLKENDGILVTDLEIFTDVSRAVINTLQKKDYIEIIEKQVQRNPFINKNIKKDHDLKLTEEQQNAYNNISKCLDTKKFKEFLIYGVTGSRKNGSVFTIDKKDIR